MSRQKTHAEFLEQVYNLVGDEYKVIDRYKKSDTKIKFLHLTCNNEFIKSPNDFLAGHMCIKCGIRKRTMSITKTIDKFKKEVFNLVGDEYKVLGNYKNARTNIKILHTICGFEFFTTPDNFLRGNRCPNCFGTHKKTTKQFKEEVCKLVKNEYSVMGKYKNTNTKIELIHNLCKFKYSVRPADFLKGKRCPKCALKDNESKIATKLKEYFKENFNSEIEYNQVKNPKTKRWLPYDIYISDFNAYIEVNGIQHYELSKWHIRQGKRNNRTPLEEFKYQKHKDKIKKDFAKKHGTYIEVDLRKIKSFEEALDYIEPILNKIEQTK